MNLTPTEIIDISIFGILLLVFLFLAWKDLSMLVRRPIKGLGTGFGRIWAVARITMFEAWSLRIWLAPVLWLIISMILLYTVRGYDDTELIPLYVRVLLWGQEIIVLLILWVMACMSLPRDRERKIVISNASKPLSRLEILLGKMTGFSAVAFVLFFLMGIATWGMLKFEDMRIRSNAAAQAQLAKNDYSVKENSGQAARPEVLTRLANEGTLFAYNYITVPPGGMSIVGKAEPTPDGMIRYIKGGSYENIIYTFSPRIMAKNGALLSPLGQRPYFHFRFPISPYFPGQPMPPSVKIQVTAVTTSNRLHPQSHTVTLARDGSGGWEPDEPEKLFTATTDYASYLNDDDRGEIELTITCPTQGVFLQILEGANPDPVTHTLPANAFFNVYAVGDRDATGPWIPPRAHPRVIGFVRHDRQDINGPDKREHDFFGDKLPTEVAIFRFPAKNLHEVPVEDGTFTLVLNMDVDRASNQLQDTKARIQIYNEEAPTVMETYTPTVIEKRVVPMKIPASFLGDNDPAKRGDLIIMLQCTTIGHSLSLLDDSLRLEQPQSFFITTLMKSEMVLFCEAVLLIVVSVTCSVRLGWPVALLTSAGCYVLGYCSDLLLHAIDNGGLGAINVVNYGERHGAAKLLDTSLEALWQFLSFVSTHMPNINKFDDLSYITQLRNMPLSVMGGYVLLTIFCVVPFIALGYLLIRKQELG